MIKLVIKLGTLTTFLVAMNATSSLTPTFAAGGGGGGGGEASSVMDPGPSYPPSSYPKRSGNKATHKVKKNNKQSGIDDPAFSQGYRAAYATIYDRNEYAGDRRSPRFQVRYAPAVQARQLLLKQAGR